MRQSSHSRIDSCRTGWEQKHSLIYYTYPFFGRKGLFVETKDRKCGWESKSEKKTSILYTLSGQALNVINEQINTT